MSKQRTVLRKFQCSVLQSIFQVKEVYDPRGVAEKDQPDYVQGLETAKFVSKPGEGFQDQDSVQSVEVQPGSIPVEQYESNARKAKAAEEKAAEEKAAEEKAAEEKAAEEKAAEEKAAEEKAAEEDGNPEEIVSVEPMSDHESDPEKALVWLEDVTDKEQMIPLAIKFGIEIARNKRADNYKAALVKALKEKVS